MIFASNNKGKLREIKEIFAEYEVKSLKEAGIDIEVDENQDSFYGNALKKAKEIYEIAKEPVIADDSGICINVFNGWPGVLTHRFLGEDSTPRERNLAMLDKLKDSDDRSAAVVCDLVYYDGKDIIVGEGIINGTIAQECRGENGFGFDEIFELSNSSTMAELSIEEKNKISARSLAAIDLKEKLKK